MSRTSPTLPSRTLFLILVSLCTAGAVSAQPFIKGVRISTTSVETGGGQLEVGFVVSQFASSGTGVVSPVGTLPLGYPSEPDIQFGDGNSISDASVVFDGSGTYATATDTGNPVYRYRGTFTHTYADVSPQTVSVFSGCCSNTHSEAISATSRHYQSTDFASYRSVSATAFSRTFTGPQNTSLYRYGFYDASTILLDPNFGTITGQVRTPYISSSTESTLSTVLTYSGMVTTFISTTESGTRRSGFSNRTTSSIYDVRYSVRARGFTNTLFLDVIFGDGFETGDTNDWS